MSLTEQTNEQGVGSSEETSAEKRLPPLSESTLALAAELEAKRHAENINRAVAIAVGATIMKIGEAIPAARGVRRVLLTQEDFNRFNQGFDLTVEPLKDGDVLHVNVLRKDRGAA